MSVQRKRKHIHESIKIPRFQSHESTTHILVSMGLPFEMKDQWFNGPLASLYDALLIVLFDFENISELFQHVLECDTVLERWKKEE